MRYKKCCTCKIMLPENNFSIRQKAKDGLQATCKECKNKTQNKERAKARKLKS